MLGKDDKPISMAFTDHLSVGYAWDRGTLAEVWKNPPTVFDNTDAIELKWNAEWTGKCLGAKKKKKKNKRKGESSEEEEDKACV